MSTMNLDPLFFPAGLSTVDSETPTNVLPIRPTVTGETEARLRQRIDRARWSLQQGLKVPGTVAAQRHFEQALRELGRLGAE